MNGQGKDYGPSVRIREVPGHNDSVLTAPPNQASPVLSGSRLTRRTGIVSLSVADLTEADEP